MESMNPSQAVQVAEKELGETVWYSVLHRSRWIKTLQYLAKACPPDSHPKLLDIGVWPGYQSLALQRMGYSVVGLDLGPERLPTLPFSTQRFDLNTQDTFPFPEASLDVVVATEIIEHIQPERLPVVLQAAQQVLRPGGVLLITTPNRKHLGALMKSREHGTDVAGHGHTHEYTVSELRQYFKSGWHNCKIQIDDMYGTVGTVTPQHYYRPLWKWWRQPRPVHNSLKFVSSLVQHAVPQVRDTIVAIAKKEHIL